MGLFKNVYVKSTEDQVVKKVFFSGIGFVVAPLVSSLIAAYLTPIDSGHSFFSGFGLVPIFYFFSLLATFFLGLPAFIFLRHFNAINCGTTTGAGLLVGGIVGIILRLPNSPQIGDFVTMVPIGGISAFTFWLIWRIGHR